MAKEKIEKVKIGAKGTSKFILMDITVRLPLEKWTKKELIKELNKLKLFDIPKLKMKISSLKDERLEIDKVLGIYDLKKRIEELEYVNKEAEHDE